MKKTPGPLPNTPLAVTFLPQPGEFVSKYGDHVEFEKITEMAAGYDYVLIGEGHRNAVDHKVQQALFEALSRSGDGLVLGLEMIAVDKQLVLEDFCAGAVTVAELPEELEWQERWGYDFELFRHHFELARKYSVPVVGLNVPSRVTRKISREGMDALTGEEYAFLPRTIVPPSSDQRTTLDVIFDQHETKDTADPVQRERFHLVQSIWDSKMAEEAVNTHKQYEWPVFIVAGAGHVEYSWGIAKRLRMFDPGARVLTIMPWRGDEFDADAGDVFFYSPDVYVSKMGATLAAQGNGGLLVERVERASRAAKAGLRPGDVLVEASGVVLNHLFSLHMAGKKVHDSDEELIFTVRRGTETFTANVGRLGKTGKTEQSDDKE